jgi:hypothetical protein
VLKDLLEALSCFSHNIGSILGHSDTMAVPCGYNKDFIPDYTISHLSRGKAQKGPQRVPAEYFVSDSDFFDTACFRCSQYLNGLIHPLCRDDLDVLACNLIRRCFLLL